MDGLHPPTFSSARHGMRRRPQAGSRCLSRLAQCLALCLGTFFTAAHAFEPEWGFDGRAQLDQTRFDGVYSRDGGAATAGYLRRADLGATLRWAPDWRARVAVQADSDDVWLDALYVSWQADRQLRLSAGRIDPDFGLENTMSSSWVAGIERSAIWDLVPGIADSEDGAGLRADAHGGSWHASAGLYDKRARRAVVARAVWFSRGEQPRVRGQDRRRADEGRAPVWQVGLSLAHADGDDDDGRLRTRLGLRGVSETAAGRRSDLAEAVPPPGVYEGSRAVALELAHQRGPWLVQAEALWLGLSPVRGAPSRSASGQTVQLSWSPDGAVRRFDERQGRFGRPLGEDRAWGRWELFARLDRLEADMGRGAEVATVGASWFQGRHWRLSANAVFARSDDPNGAGDDSGQGLALRAQAVF